MKKTVLFILCGLLAFAGAAGAQTIDFEDLTLAPESYWNGSDGEGGFESGFAFFNNEYNDEWDVWSGFAYSNRTDTEARDYIFNVGLDAGGDFNAITGSGYGGSDIYAVAYVSAVPTVVFDEAREIEGAYFTNNTITYYAMLEGNDHGARSFDATDWLRVKVTGFDEEGEETGERVFFLAQDGEIVDDWKWVDFSILGVVKRIEFEMSSSDTGEWGMNTPAYFCMDNLKGAPLADEDTPGEDEDTPREDEDTPGEDEDADEIEKKKSSSSTCFINTVAPGLF